MSGGRGKVWWTLCKQAGLKSDQLSYCTADQFPEILSQRPWERIDVIDWPGGRSSNLERLTGLKQGVMKWRGSPSCLTGESTPRVMPILDPLYVMKDSAYIPAVLSDLMKGLKIPPQRYVLHPTVDEVGAFNAEKLCIDIETNWHTREITLVGISKTPYEVLVVPYKPAYIPHLRRICATAEAVIGQNIIGFDIPVLAANGITFKNDVQVWDTMLLHHLVQPDCPHDLEFIASICTQMVAWKHLANQQPEFYNACDVDATYQSFNELYAHCKFLGLLDLYNYVQWPLQKICSQMKEGGIALDPNRAAQRREHAMAALHELEKQLPASLQSYYKPKRKRIVAPAGTLNEKGKPVKFLYEATQEKVTPWQSPKQIENYLYNVLKLPEQYHRKTKRLSTDKITLSKLTKLSAGKPWMQSVVAIQKLRSLEELISTFYKETDATRPIELVHANFLVHGTGTGRLSSSGPNMQNIPKEARYLYVPSRPDWCFVEADFSSLENRLAAWYANDTPRLQRLSTPGFNEHLWLARQMYGDHITKEDKEYKLGKITNHGADGAMGPRMLAQTHNLAESEAKFLIASWRKINHLSAEWQERVGNEATSKGVLKNAFGRMRWFYSNGAYTEGIRFFPQSTGADICFRSMISIGYQKIGWPVEWALKAVEVLAPLPEASRLVLQVHDSLLVECHISQRETVIDCLRRAMTQPWPQLGGFSIPVEIKAGDVGNSWAELETV